LSQNDSTHRCDAESLITIDDLHLTVRTELQNTLSVINAIQKYNFLEIIDQSFTESLLDVLENKNLTIDSFLGLTREAVESLEDNVVYHFSNRYLEVMSASFKELFWEKLEIDRIPITRKSIPRRLYREAIDYLNIHQQRGRPNRNRKDCRGVQIEPC